MKPRTVWAVYFSPTHTTEKTVRTIAEVLAQVLDIPMQVRQYTLPQQRQEDMTFSADDLVVFGTPVYAGRVPNLMLPYLTGKVHGQGAGAVPVVVYGNRDYDEALEELRNILEDDGFHTVAAAACIGEHSFSRTLGAGRPDEKDMAWLSSFATRTAERVKALEVWPEVPVDIHAQEHPWVYYRPMDAQGNLINILKVKPKTDESKCIRCGLCARLCPMGSIDSTDVTKVMGVCIKCCACVKDCPADAKYFDDPGYELHRTILETKFSRRKEPEQY